MAAYLEQVQWKVRPATVIDEPTLGPPLPVIELPFGELEVGASIRRMAKNKATGPDDVPAEYWQRLADNAVALAIAVDFLNACWNAEKVPDQWHLAFVSAIFKKGSTADCENYRPISLLCVGYKLFASLLKARLVDAGAEERLSKTQFGFRSGYGTVDAVFVLRRRIELALAQRSGKVLVLALDWQKAFDSIDPAAMVAGLRRFGVPAKILNIVTDIYARRLFQVWDSGYASQAHVQHSGISQGCPLSPFLFSMVMTVIVHDAVARLEPRARQLYDTGVMSELLYADDTLLISEDSQSLESMLFAIEAAGASFGLVLHSDKFQLMKIGTEGVIRRADGRVIPPSSQIVYLGSLISEDGRIEKELGRRIGAAKAEFRELARAWRL